MEQFKGLQKTLFIWSQTEHLEKQVEQLKSATGGEVLVENVNRLSLANHAPATFDLIVVDNAQLTDAFGQLLKLLKTKGKLYILTFVGSADSIMQELKMLGFINSKLEDKTITCEKPSYEIGSAVKLSFAKPKPTAAPAVWKLDDDDEVEEDLINEDDLLDEEDKKKPDPESLREPKNLLVLTEEFPYVCYQCLEDLKICCTTYEKIKLANKQLNDIYEESINQYIDEEYLIEIEDEETKQATNQISLKEADEEEDSAFNHYISSESHELDPLEQDASLRNTNRFKRIALDSNDAFVVTQFIPATLQTQERDNRQEFIKDDEQNYCLHQQMLTVNLRAVEVKDIENLQNSQILDSESNERAIYVCQYCPQAFAKSDYLKTHIEKCHVCKFCTQAFNATEELFKHIREIHTEHKCVICHKVLSSQTNLRHHIRRVHRINLPAKVTLLDFIKSSSQVNDSQAPEVTVETLQDLTSLNDVVEPNIEYIWKNEDNIEMLTEHIVE